MFEHKDYKLTQRLVQFIFNFVTLGRNEISSLTLNKIVCSYLITYFEARNSIGNGKLVEYIDACLVNMIKYLVDDVEMHTRQAANRSRYNNGRTVGLIRNNAKFCALMAESIVEEAMRVVLKESQIAILSFDCTTDISTAGEHVSSLGHMNGRFGWCLVCKKAADYYCKDQKVPICGYSCKLLLVELTHPVSSFKESKLTLVQVMLKYFVKLSSKRNENMNIDFKAYVLSHL